MALIPTMSPYEILSAATTTVTGTAYQMRKPLRHIQVVVAGDNGATVVIEGSNSVGANFETLNTFVFVSAGADSFVVETPIHYLRARVSAIGADTSVTVTEAV
jgi:hypothetical protein